MHGSSSIVASLLAIVIGFGSPAAGVEPSLECSERSPQRWVVRVEVDDRAAVDRIASWIEPWEVDLEQGFVLVDVDAAEWNRLLDEGFELSVDGKRTERLRDFMVGGLQGGRGIPGYACYRTVEETLTTGAQLAGQYPGLAQWVDIGDSWEKVQNPANGYDLMMLRLTNTAVAGDKPKLWLQGGIHARELVSAELATRFAEDLLAGYGVDPDMTWLLDHHEILILLQTNPDGRKKAEAGDSWRKNTNATTCGYTSGIGADLNRNFSFEWACCGGSSSYGCDTTYHGAAPASEPETQAVEDMVRAEFPDQRPDDLVSPAPDDAMGIFLDLHSFGEIVLSPWGFQSSPPPNGDQILRLARKLGYINHYDSKLGSTYTVDGSTKDFAYGELGMAGYTIELGTDFFQDCAAFESTIYPDNIPALLYAAKASRAPYLLPAGPDVVDLAALPSVVAPGEPVVLSAIADDTRFDDYTGTEPTQDIAAAEVYVDIPPWQLGAVGVSLGPSDGTFNSTVEGITGQLDTTGLAVGRHLLFVRARDADGSWGAVSAAFVWLLDPATAGTFTGTVLSSEGSAPLSATVSAGPFSTTTDPVSGSYALLVPEGTHDLTATAPDHAPVTAAGLSVGPGESVTRDFVLPRFQRLLDDDVEGGNIGWTAQSPWAITAEASSSPTHSWTDSPGSSYGNYANVSLTSPPLDLTGLSSVRLAFSHDYDIESGWDYGHVESSGDGGATWQTAASYTGTSSGPWQRVVLDLPALAGAANARVRFRLVTDSNTVADGWHVDDIVVEAVDPDGTILIFKDGFESGDTSGWATASP
jgi:hypothetical protein